GYNPIYEYSALPDVEQIIAAVERSVATRHERTAVAAGADRGHMSREPEIVMPESAARGALTSPATPEAGQKRSITVPVMGEGIRNAKVVSLLKHPGDTISHDDELCEVETDKAVYPIQSSFAGVMGEWKTKVGDTVEIGQELGTIITAEASFADQFQEATEESASAVEAAVPSRKQPEVAPEDRRHYKVEPALSPTITRKLLHVIPANLQIDARWDAIRKSRDAAKRKNGNHVPSPS